MSQHVLTETAANHFQSQTMKIHALDKIWIDKESKIMENGKEIQNGSPSIRLIFYNINVFIFR